VSPQIRVDTENLKKNAAKIDVLASELEKTGSTIYQNTYSLNDYGGQLPTKKDALMAQQTVNSIRGLWKEEAQQLRDLAGKFEAVDQQTIDGINSSITSIASILAQIMISGQERDSSHYPPPVSHGDWDPNTPNGTVTRPGDNNFGPTQFINLEKLIPGFTYTTPPAQGVSHHLCGILTVFHLAGITDPVEGFKKMLAAGGRMSDLLTADLLTNPDDLQKLCALLGLKTDPSVMVPAGTFLDPSVFKAILAKGGKIIVLVNLKENWNGTSVITDPKDALGVGHWVSVEDMWVDGSGQTWVEVWNPYNNRYETYTWDTFAAAMQEPGQGNERGGFYIPVYP
jgi:hypothetical protein